MKALLVPGMLFEELGFAYIGVVDGHDLHALRASIRQAIDTERPVVVHVKTVKGKGYEPAEDHPETFHGTGPFHLGNGARKGVPAGTTYTEAFGQALVRLAEQDERIVRDHGRDDAGHRSRGVRAPLPRPLLRRRHRRGARRRVRRRPRHRRPAAGRRRLLHLPAARLRHARAGRRPAAAAGGLRRRPRRARRRRRAHAPRRLRPLVPAPHPQLHRHGAVEPGGAAAHAGHGSDARRPRRASATRAAWRRSSTAPDELEPLPWAKASCSRRARAVALVGIGTGVGIAREAAALLRGPG